MSDRLLDAAAVAERLGVPGTLEPLSNVLESGASEQTRELEDVLVGHRNAREHHRSEAT